MKKLIVPILLLLSLNLSLRAEDNGTLVKTGQQVPAFTVKMFDGTTVNIQDLKGKVVLVNYKGKTIFLNFWATWCPPCRQELTRVQKDIIDRFKGRDFVFLPISRQEKYETVKAFREKTGYTFPMGLDTDRKVFALFATESIPRNFLIGKDGKIVFMEIGYSEESFQKLIQEIEKALKAN